MKLGIIGTNWISEAFYQAAKVTGKYELTSIYSRKQATGQTFAEKCGAGKVYTDFDNFVAQDDQDIVYVASPNVLHFEQSCALVKAGKHVIIEKPAFSNAKEAEIVYDLAKKERVFVFEAARHIFEANFQKLKEQMLTVGKLRGATLPYMKYSSRYDQVLNGGEPNIFSLKFSGGALYDLGVYLVYAAVELFGEPEACHYFPIKIRTGVDGMGHILFEYPTYNVMMPVGKICDSQAKVEIYGESGTLIADRIERVTSIVHTKTPEIDHATPRDVPNMYEEAAAFAEIIEANDQTRYQKLVKLSKTVHALMEKMRKANDIIFAADQK